jgi:predicted DNA-binding transcriptional regulator YafY
VLPAEAEPGIRGGALLVSKWGAAATGLDMKAVRRAIREERKLSLGYIDAEGRATRRTVRPIAVVYYVEVTVVAAWCELRSDFRHFRADRIASCRPLAARFTGEGDRLRALWERQRPLNGGPVA